MGIRVTIGTAWFGKGTRHKVYDNLSKVWRLSAHKVFGSEYNIIHREHEPSDFEQPCPVFMRGNRKIGKSKSLAWREKIRNWYDIVSHAGGPVLMTDIDVAFFDNPFPAVWEESGGFDVGLCGESTGAVYFSGSDKSRDFMRRWLEATEWLFNNEKEYKELDKRYKGLDQASMGLLLEDGTHGADVMQLPYKYHSTCHQFELPCYVMHYHSKMRSAAFGRRPISELAPELQPYAESWVQMLKEAQGDERGCSEKRY